MAICCFAAVSAIAKEPSADKPASLLPVAFGDFRAGGPVIPLPAITEDFNRDGYEVLETVTRVYRTSAGNKLHVLIYRARSDSASYSLFTQAEASARALPDPVARTSEVGTAAYTSGAKVAFFKGSGFVVVRNLDERNNDLTDAMALAKLIADTLDRGENDIPALVRHLPDWEQAQTRAMFLTSRDLLKYVVGPNEVLDAIDFSGGTEAITATYDGSRLLIVEYSTPQLATVADGQIIESIKALSQSGKAVPSLYRRVGNYAVFVFEAPDQATAERLIEQVSYEKVVQWLGANPRLYERAEREYRQLTAGVILAVIESTGISLLICLGVGALFGGFIFRRRRAQQAEAKAYSDAGGMLRLNVDDLSTQINSERLLGDGRK